MSHLRYFTFPGYSYDFTPFVGDLIDAGVTIWTSYEYETALFSLMGADCHSYTLDFNVACVENDDNSSIIRKIAAKYEPHIKSGSTCCSYDDDVYIDALCRLGSIRGVKIIDDNYTLNHFFKRKDCEPLSQLLGIDKLEKFRGWIDRQTTEFAWVYVYLPQNRHRLSLEILRFPISSCPTLKNTTSPEMEEPLPTENDTQLRPYQTEMKANIMKAWQNSRRVMLQMPTGTGKTRLFVSLIRDIRQQQSDARVLIVAHRTELIDQISHSLTYHYGLKHSILGRKEETDDATILIASIQMLSRRAGKEESLNAFDYIIIDEAHHSLAPTYKSMLDAYPLAKVLGVTATPYRLKKASFTELYDTLVESSPMRQFLSDGYLASYRLFTVSDRMAAMSKINRLTKFGADGDYKAQDLKEIFDTEAEITQLYDCYEMYSAGKKGIIYAVSRDHAAHIATLFNNNGVKAASIDCDTPKEERQRIIDEFKANNGCLQVLVNVELFTEGFDCPSIEFVMLARPTRSLTLYLQQVGRALRPTPDGGEVIILDYAGLYNRFGLPERSRDWQSHFKGEKPKNEDYNKRPLGTSSVNGFMAEMSHNRKQIVYTDGTFSIYTTLGSKKYGLCDTAGHVVFRPLYDKITPTPYGWFIGESHEWSNHYDDVLSPNDAKTYKFRSVKEIEEGVFSAIDSNSDVTETYTLRFNRNLRLIPSSSMKVGTKGYVYVHGDTSTEQFYTMSLNLDAPIYRKCTTMNNGIVMLNGIHCHDSVVVDDKVSNIKNNIKLNGNTYTVTSDDWRISSGGTVFWPVLKGFLLRYTKYDKGITLYDAHFTPLLHGNSIEAYEDHCVIQRDSQSPLTIDYIDYLRFGIEQ